MSARVKKFYPEEEDFVRFVVDYITNPSKEKVCVFPWHTVYSALCLRSGNPLC